MKKKNYKDCIQIEKSTVKKAAKEIAKEIDKEILNEILKMRME